MTVLNFGRDVQGYNAYAPQLSNYMLNVELAAADEESVTVTANTGNYIAVFSYQPGATIWVSVNDTAAPPAGATFAATTSFLLPAQLQVKAGDEISFYNNSTTDMDVGVAFYAVP